MSAPAESINERNAQALRHVLQPLMAWALSQGLTYQQIDGWVRNALVAAAARTPKGAGEGAAANVSRIHVLTGLHRRDIAARLAGSDAASTPPAPGLTTQLMEHWTAGAPYADANLMPLPLPRLRKHGGAFSFEALVERLGKNVRARSILDVLIAEDAAQIDSEDRVVPRVRRGTQRIGRIDQADLIARHLGDHATTLVRNLLDAERGDYESTVYSRHLPAAAVDALCEWFVPKVNSLLIDVNLRVTAAEIAAQALPPEARSERFTVGAFVQADGRSRHVIRGHAPQKKPGKEK